MNFNIENNIAIQINNVDNIINKLTEDLRIFKNDYKKAITEINAIKDSGSIKTMQDIITSYLPDSYPTEIITGILHESEWSYNEYLKKQSVKWNNKIGNTICTEKIEKYQNEMRDYLKLETKKGSIGSYYFLLNKINLQLSTSLFDSIKLIHSNDLSPKVILFSDSSNHDLEKDEVGLEQYLADIRPKYLIKISDLLKKDAEELYQKNINDNFIPKYHSKFILKLKDFLSNYKA